MQASIDSFDTSLTATFAPYLASASAMPLPMFGPHPVTSATLPSSEISTVSSSIPRIAWPDLADYVARRAGWQSAASTDSPHDSANRPQRDAAAPASPARAAPVGVSRAAGAGPRPPAPRR